MLNAPLARYFQARGLLRDPDFAVMKETPMRIPILISIALLAGCGGGGSNAPSAVVSPTAATADVDQLHSAEIVGWQADALALERQCAAQGDLISGTCESALATLFESHVHHFLDACVAYQGSLNSTDKAADSPAIVQALTAFQTADINAFNSDLITVGFTGNPAAAMGLDVAVTGQYAAAIQNL